MPCPWERFERATLDTCEPDVCGWIVHPTETTSALAYLIVALIVWGRYRHLDQDIPARYLPSVVTLIGLGSALFHASFAAPFHALDLAVIFLFTGYMLAALLIHRGQLRPPRLRSAFAVFGIGGGLLPFLHLWLGFAGLAVEGGLVLWWARGGPPGASTRDYRAALWLLLAGVALLILDHSQIGCVRGTSQHVVQPHAVWHLLSAASFYFFYRYERVLERRWPHSSAA